MEGLSFICGVVAVEQIRPNSCYGISIYPFFLGEVVQYRVSTKMTRTSASIQISLILSLTSNGDNQIRLLTCHISGDLVGG